MPRVLILSSANSHFPGSFDQAIKDAGHELARCDDLDDFLCSPHRHEPFLAILEIGNLEDVERALIAYDWIDTVQPLAPMRVMLMLATRNIELGARRTRFGNSEIIVLPMPTKNFLFKLDLQLRLVSSEKAKPAEGFTAFFVGEERQGTRVLILRGPGKAQGSWVAQGNGVRGGVRWRWVSKGAAKPEQTGKIQELAWEAESKKEPHFDDNKSAWVIDDADADLLCFRKGQEFFSARSQAHLDLLPDTSSQETPAEDESAKRRAVPAKERPDPEAAAKAPAIPQDPISRLDTAKPDLTPESKHSAKAAEPPPEARVRRDGAEPDKAEEKRIAGSPNSESHSAEPAPWNQIPSGSGEPMPTPVSDKSRSTGQSVGGVEGLKKAVLSQARRSLEKEAAAAETSSVPFGNRTGAGETALPGAKASEIAKGQQVMSFREPEPRATSPAERPRRESEAPGEKAEPPAATRAQEIVAQSARAENAAGQSPQTVETAAPEKIDSRSGPPSQVREGEALAREQARPAERPRTEAHATEPEAARAAPERTEITKGAVAAPGGRTALPQAGNPAQEERVKIAAAPVVTGPENEQVKSGRALPQDDSSRIDSHWNPQKEGFAWTVKEGQAAPEKEQNVGKTQHWQDEARKLLASRHFLTMTLAELRDQNSSWQPVEDYRIYLAANHRYYGVKTIEELFPLWIYQGELAPEFLAAGDGWKFYDRLPEQFFSIESVPVVVAVYLRRMVGAPTASAGLSAEDLERLEQQNKRRGGSGSTAQEDADSAKNRGLWGQLWGMLRKLVGG